MLLIISLASAGPMTNQHLWLCIWLEYLYDTKDSDEMKYRVRNKVFEIILFLTLADLQTQLQVKKYKSTLSVPD